MRKLVSLAVCIFVASASQVFADPNPMAFEGWKTDFSRHSVPLSEIISGGPPRDGIPPIDAPRFAPVPEIVDVAANEPVIALIVDGQARAYPLAILTWHEIVNDRIAGRPVIVTYCPLCNAAIAFDGRHDGRELTFGTTGRLRKSDLVMYDRQTETWWQQFSGEAIVGEMTGRRLKTMPVTVLPYSLFVERYPQGEVLMRPTPPARDYGRNPYAGYDTSDRPFLYDGDMPEGIDPMERVVVAGEDANAIIAVRVLREKGAVETDGIRIEWQAGMASALDDAAIAKGRDVGHVSVTRNGEAITHHVTFAFVAHAFHPDVPIVGAETSR